MQRNILIYKYFVQHKKILHKLDNLGIARKTVSSTSPTAQTIKYYDIFVCISSERHQQNKCYLITCVSIRIHQYLSDMCYVRLFCETIYVYVLYVNMRLI